MAILNQREYRAAKARLAHLDATRTSRSFEETASGISSDVAEARSKALRDEYEKISSEIVAYENLWGKEVPSFDQLATLDLGLLPIVGRIARGWSQKQLAEALGLKEQQIQRYESERYASISLARFDRILKILGAKLTGDFEPQGLGVTARKDSNFYVRPAVLKEIVNRGWFPDGQKKTHAELVAAIQKFVGESSTLRKEGVLHRKTLRSDERVEGANILLWEARVLKVAFAKSERIRNRFDIADMSWLKEFVRLSVHSNAPRLALEYLAEKGIVVVIEQQLPQTLLDGAALLLSNGIPVIALTLRYDRLDYFWFTLLHELGHLFLHFHRGLVAGYLDDLESDERDDDEKAADSFARSTLISDEAWKAAPVRFSKSVELAKSFASAQGIHVAIVAGRLRRERKDFSRLSAMIGQGELRGSLKGF